MENLPEKWCLKSDRKEFVDYVNENGFHKNSYGKNELSTSYAHFPSYGYGTIATWVKDGYTEIKFEDFEKFILKKEIMQTEIKIEIPKGMMIDEENSSFTHIKFKPINGLPKRWEDLGLISGYFVNYTGIGSINGVTNVSNSWGKMLFPTKKLAEAAFALSELLQLRDTYNDDWNPNWDNMNEIKYVIYIKSNNIEIGSNRDVHRVLSFKSLFLVKEFLKNFKDLIEIAKPLL